MDVKYRIKALLVSHFISPATHKPNSLHITKVTFMNNKAISYTLLVAYIAAACYTPVWVLLWTVAFFIAVPFFTEVVNTLLPVDGDYLYKSPAPRMSDYYDAFSVEPEELTVNEALSFEHALLDQLEEDTTPCDVWGVDVTACELACTITSQYNYNYQLCLPTSNDIDISIDELTIEPVVVIDYTSYS